MPEAQENGQKLQLVLTYDPKTGGVSIDSRQFGNLPWSTAEMVLHSAHELAKFNVGLQRMQQAQMAMAQQAQAHIIGQEVARGKLHRG